MSDRDLRELVGDGAAEDELAALRRAHEALLATAAPPVVSESLTSRVLSIPREQRRLGGGTRRALAGLAAAAAIAGAAFGIGWWASGGEDGVPPLAGVIELEPTAAAPEGAWMRIDVLPVDDAGNWAMAADAGGLEPLPPGAYYELWLTDDGELASSCGRFAVDERGEATDVWLNAPYPFERYDRWVVVSVRPGETPSPSLLDGPVVATG